MNQWLLSVKHYSRYWEYRDELLLHEPYLQGNLASYGAIHKKDDGKVGMCVEQGAGIEEDSDEAWAPWPDRSGFMSWFCHFTALWHGSPRASVKMKQYLPHRVADVQKAPGTGVAPSSDAINESCLPSGGGRGSCAS